jgi:hypothetical protein
MSFISVGTADGTPHEIRQFSRDTSNFQNNVTGTLDFVLEQRRLRTPTDENVIELLFGKKNEWQLYCVCEDLSSYGPALTQVGLHHQTVARKTTDKDLEYLWHRVPYVNPATDDGYKPKSFPERGRNPSSGAAVSSTPANKYRYADVTISMDGVKFVPQVCFEGNPCVARVCEDECKPTATNLLRTNPPNALKDYAELAACVVDCWSAGAARA